MINISLTESIIVLMVGALCGFMIGLGDEFHTVGSLMKQDSVIQAIAAHPIRLVFDTLIGIIAAWCFLGITLGIANLDQP